MLAWGIRARLVIRVILGAAGIAAGSVAASILLTETSLRVPLVRRAQPDDARAATIGAELGASWQPVEILSLDGVALRGWLFRPRATAREAVIVQHGYGDTRNGVLDLAAMLLRNGFAVLTPDGRGHGSSGDALVTFGISEAEDLRRWSAWLRQTGGADRVYGLGESLGAASVLQSLGNRAPFEAAVAECAFVTFPRIAMHRLTWRFRLPEVLLGPIVGTGFAYARLFHGIDLGQASPLEALSKNRVPVLLIHGAEDRNVPPEHSRALHHAGGGHTELWIVPGAGHINAGQVTPEEFERRVVGWFRARH